MRFIILFPIGLVLKKCGWEAEGVGCADGNHTNFLRLNDTILFPYYGDEISAAPLKVFQNSIDELGLQIEVIPVDTTEIIALAKLGGVLNCISWQV